MIHWSFLYNCCAQRFKRVEIRANEEVYQVPTIFSIDGLYLATFGSFKFATKIASLSKNLNSEHFAVFSGL